MTYIVTYIEVRPDSTSEAIALIQQYGKTTGEEKGNSRVDLLREIHRRNRFVVIEAWEDESFQTHEDARHTAQFRSKLRDIHSAPYDQRVHHGFVVQPNSRTGRQGVLFVVTHVDVPPPRRDETEILLKRLGEQSPKDEGNLRYDIVQQSARPNHFTVVAAWASESAFLSYGTKPHTLQFREAIGPMLGAPYDERLYEMLG